MTEGMRAMLYKVALWADIAETAEDEKEKKLFERRVDLLIPICKAYCSDHGFRVTEYAVQTLGGYGYIAEYPMEQYLRDAKIASIYEGTNGIQALDLLGRKLGMKGGMVFMQYMQDLAAAVEQAKGVERLAGVAAGLEKSQAKLAETVMGFQGAMASGNSEAVWPVLSATPFLEAMGHVTVAWFLADMAVMAQGKLDALCADKGVDAADRKAYRAFLGENDEAKFLDGKVQSAIWFANNVLPEADGIFKSIGTKDLSALQVVL
ncbi:MAG: acyl-CoA dehydrogenase C-terminal domain-containing protein [Deltaproteobacteria bacterium]|nr:acyl-CoA dehydrogenase C-terminal domain-containing protein [Deltaproteobacteria bacterium]